MNVLIVNEKQSELGRSYSLQIQPKIKGIHEFTNELRW